MPTNVAETFLDHLFHPNWPLPAQMEDQETTEAIVRCYETTGGATFSLYFGDQAGRSMYVVGLDNNLLTIFRRLYWILPYAIVENKTIRNGGKGRDRLDLLRK